MMTMFGAIMVRRQFVLVTSGRVSLRMPLTAGSGFGKGWTYQPRANRVSSPVGLVYLLLHRFTAAGLSSPSHHYAEMLCGGPRSSAYELLFLNQVPPARVLPILMFTIMLTLAYSVFGATLEMPTGSELSC